jgi:biopolymer transport protein ExbB
MTDPGRLLAAGWFGFCVATASGADPSLDELMGRALLDYTQRLDVATEELGVVRLRIAEERIPLMESIRTMEDRIIELEAEVGALEIASARAEQDRLASENTWDSLVVNLDYAARVSQENLEGLQAALSPGEAGLYEDRIETLMRTLDRASKMERGRAAIEVMNLQMERLRRQIGGYALEGVALSARDNRIRKGYFAFVGPESFFASEDFTLTGTVRLREESPVPTVHALRFWDRDSARSFFEGGPGTMMADASGGKALPFQESRDSLYGHVRKGGMVGWVIIGLGAFALVASLIKVFDLRRLSVDEPGAVRDVLDALVTTSVDQAEQVATCLRSTTRELMDVGLRNVNKPKALLEEHLSAFILRQRIDHERRLPLLAVIAAAAPLLGLLGTVVGMVKTFTLITIYGTGNAGRLSTGISEALITTELGLIVAIPTLVLHGFLHHRTQKYLSLLEQYAVEFVTASEERRAGQAPNGEVQS